MATWWSSRPAAKTPRSSRSTNRLAKSFGNTPVPGRRRAGYSSIIIVNAAGVKQYVQFLAKGVVGVDAKTGKFLWRYDHTAQGSPANIPTPVVDDELHLHGHALRRRRHS